MTQETSNNGIGEKPVIHSLQERYKNGSAETVAQDEYKPLEFDPNSAFAMVVTRKHDTHGRLDKTLLKINSPHLLQAFRDVVVSHPTVPEGFEAPIELESPFAMLYHHWDALHGHKTTLTEETELLHLDLLLDFMRLEMGKKRTDIGRTAQNGSIKFDDLWAIFQPDEVVPLFERQLFGGNTPANITSLPLYPFALSKEDTSVRDELIERGRKIEELQGIQTMRYNGICEYQKIPPRSWFDPKMEDYDTVWLGFTETGRVVIDPKTYLEDYPIEAKTLSRLFPNDYRAWSTTHFGSLEQANRALCAPFIHGYSLKKKEWCKFFYESLEDIQWNEDAINSLVIDEGQKAVLQALVTSHQFSENPRETQGQKGKGLVMLLHGTPGSGKTLTAEVAAELSKSPLMSISLGELYEYEWFNEAVLSELLQYATMWKAIVLIDEADVFLESRSTGKDSSAQRNALVATFLRALEYFSGIVFLTSNRVEDFDAAMKSRIHLAIQYTPPRSEVRRQIWRKRLGALPDADVEEEVRAEGVLEDLVRENMNGREIANAVVTASTLARFRGCHGFLADF
ncbi:MAG: hypothetical protein Q9162_002663 [Coniocarpon cinnabarinum]